MKYAFFAVALRHVFLTTIQPTIRSNRSTAGMQASGIYPEISGNVMTASLSAELRFSPSVALTHIAPRGPDPAPLLPSLITRIRCDSGPVGTGLQTRLGPDRQGSCVAGRHCNRGARLR